MAHRKGWWAGGWGRHRDRDGEQKEGGRDRDTQRKTDRKRQKEPDRKTKKCKKRFRHSQGYRTREVNRYRT